MLHAFMTSFIEMAGMMAAVYAVQVLLQMREEEVRGRLEPVLATGVSRQRWMMGYLLSPDSARRCCSWPLRSAMALTAGLALGGTSGLLRELTGAALAQLPAVLVIMAAVVAVFALLPRWAVPLSWLLLAASVLLSPVFGTSLGLPQWVLNISPFTHQKAPALEISTVAVAAVLAVSVALAAAGFATFRRRDVMPG